jgi:hypothetical protein
MGAPNEFLEWEIRESWSESGCGLIRDLMDGCVLMRSVASAKFEVEFDGFIFMVLLSFGSLFK